MQQFPDKVPYPTMSQHEFLHAMEHYGLDGARFSMMIGVSWRQGYRYCHGKSVIPDSVAKLIRTAMKHRLKPRQIG